MTASRLVTAPDVVRPTKHKKKKAKGNDKDEVSMEDVADTEKIRSFIDGTPCA